VIPSRSHPKVILEHDRAIYNWQHRVENRFAKIREFGAAAIRHCRKITSFRATILVAAAIIADR